MENISSIRERRAANVMVPWARVRRLLAPAGREEVLAQVARERFSRWPVVEPREGRVTGFVLARDLMATAEDDWARLVHPLQAVRPDDDIESTLARMRTEGATMYLVEEAGNPVGLITLEDIVAHVVGGIEEAYPQEGQERLREALENGGVVLNLAATTRDQAIRELANAIPGERLPPQVDRAEIARLALAREEEISTDLGNGVAIPHARCPRLRLPLVVFGRSPEGLPFSSPESASVRLVFLLVTPTERPEVQLALLRSLSRVAGDGAARDRLRRASSPAEVADVLSGRQGRGA
jgi:mannitol/fructose-specific phosphotransferase system IIA component (Ntr-type)/predicted transcriptional regulator